MGGVAEFTVVASAMEQLWLVGLGMNVKQAARRVVEQRGRLRPWSPSNILRLINKKSPAVFAPMRAVIAGEFFIQRHGCHELLMADSFGDDDPPDEVNSLMCRVHSGAFGDGD